MARIFVDGIEAENATTSRAPHCPLCGLVALRPYPTTAESRCSCGYCGIEFYVAVVARFTPTMHRRRRVR